MERGVDFSVSFLAPELEFTIRIHKAVLHHLAECSSFLRSLLFSRGEMQNTFIRLTACIKHFHPLQAGPGKEKEGGTPVKANGSFGSQIEVAADQNESEDQLLDSTASLLGREDPNEIDVELAGKGVSQTLKP